MAKKITLSPSAIDNLTKGALADVLTPGLAIEILGSGKKRWRYRRQIAGQKIVATLFGGLYPVQTIADARAWARALNDQVESGLDPRIIQKQEKARAEMTVARAHALYMIAVREGRSSRTKQANKPRTIEAKLELYTREIAPKIGKRNVYEICEKDLINLVETKGKTAKVVANRLAGELQVFFGWAASLKGDVVGLNNNPAARLADLRFPEYPRSRILSLEEISWFLQALSEESRRYQRGFLLLLLTAARFAEVTEAKSSEFSDGIWVIPSTRTKNSVEHRIALGPWGQSLMRSNREWLFPSNMLDGPIAKVLWYRARDRIRTRMEEIAGHTIERFTPHDFRRTARSNTKRLRVDFETAEAMLNHAKRGLERVYDLYELDEEKRLWFLKWENEILGIARQAGVAESLGAPTKLSTIGYSVSVKLPKGAGIQPPLNLGTPKTRTVVKFAQPTPKFIFTWEPGQTPLPESIDLPSR